MQFTFWQTERVSGMSFCQFRSLCALRITQLMKFKLNRHTSLLHDIYNSLKRLILQFARCHCSDDGAQARFSPALGTSIQSTYWSDIRDLNSGTRKLIFTNLWNKQIRDPIRQKPFCTLVWTLQVYRKRMWSRSCQLPYVDVSERQNTKNDYLEDDCLLGCCAV
jgi:hypothetical protein